MSGFPQKIRGYSTLPVLFTQPPIVNTDALVRCELCEETLKKVPCETALPLPTEPVPVSRLAETLLESSGVAASPFAVLSLSDVVPVPFMCHTPAKPLQVSEALHVWAAVRTSPQCIVIAAIEVVLGVREGILTHT